MLREVSIPRDSRSGNTAGKMDSLFAVLIVSAKPWQSCESVTSADDLLLGQHQKHARLSTNHWLVHYYTFLSTRIHIAAPKYLQFHVMYTLFTVGWQQMKCAPSC